MTLERIASDADLTPLHLVEEINHRVANTYTEAVLSLSRAAAGAMSPMAKSALERVVDRLLAQAASHRALMPPATGGFVDLGEYLGDLCESLSRASLADRGVELAVRTEVVWLATDRAWRIGLIVAELIRNAARHGLAGGGGAILVRLSEQLGSVHCQVVDNGRALAISGPGHGSHIVRRLTGELGGSVEWWFTPAGCCVQLLVPGAEPVAGITTG